VPTILLKARLCETFGWTPNELREQPADEAIQMYEALAVAARAARRRK